MGHLEMDLREPDQNVKSSKAAEAGDASEDSSSSSLSNSTPNCNEGATIDGSDVSVIKLAWYRKCLFALGGAPYQMLTNVIGFFVSIFLLNVANLPPAMCSAVLLGGRVCDALTDPLIGILVEKSPIRRIGRLKSWILFSMPFTCAVYWLFWYVPEPFHTPTTSEDQWQRFAYYFVLMLLMQLLFTCHQVPFSSLTMYISNNKAVRDSATAVRMAFEMIGVLLGVVVSSVIIKNNAACDPITNSTLNSTADITSNSTADIYSDEEIRSSYQLAAGVLVAVHIVCVLCVIIGVKEYRLSRQSEKREPFLHGLRCALGFKPYLILMFAFLQIGFVMQNVQANLVLYVTYTLRLPKFELFMGMLTMLFTGVLCVPFWQYVQVRFGKKQAFAGGLLAVLPALFAMLLVPPEFVRICYIYYPLCAVSGASVSVAYLCPWSMLPDVIDAYFLKNRVRHTSVFYSFYVFFSKLAVGVAIGVSQAVLGVIGYRNNSCDQPESVGIALRYLISVPSLVAALGSLVCVYIYPITEKVRKEHDAELRRILRFDEDSVESFVDSKPELAIITEDANYPLAKSGAVDEPQIARSESDFAAGGLKVDYSNSSSNSTSYSYLERTSTPDDGQPLV